MESESASSNYWTSTTRASNTSNAWNVNFNNGNTNNNGKTNAYYARCVRGQLFAKLKSAAAGFAIIMAQTQNLPLYLKIYQLIKFLYGAVRNFPKQYKYTLGAQIINYSWRCLDLVIEANGAVPAEKRQKIAELSAVFDKLKVRLRMAQELRLISEGQFAHIQTNYCLEAGTMIGGWLKWADGGNIHL